MSALAEAEEEEDELGDPENNKESSALPQGGKDKPTPDAKEPDPLAALGDKLAKLR